MTDASITPTSIALEAAETLALEVIAWWKRRQAEGAEPQDAEVVTYVKGQLANIVAEADAFEREEPTA